MYLSKLELHGFKSFAAPTVMRFDPGITAIVGPNGCGKSNIVDAVRWVIGEQRSRILRSGKMEDIIFNGAAKRRPLGLAEVQLTVENTRGILPTEFSEVAIGRRFYRSGESEYLLNGISCRLRDIVDIFLDTGMGAGAYSVIELKMVEQILSDNAAERRHLFEEAAGISKYKQRRHQAMRKLEAIQADLARLEDVRAEIERRVRSLKRQAAAASRQRKLEERADELRRSLAARELDRMEQQASDLRGRVQGVQQSLAKYAAELGRTEAERESLRKNLVDQEKSLSAAQTDLSDHFARTRELESDLRHERQRREATGQESARLAEEMEVEQEAAQAQKQALLASMSALEDARPRREEAIRVLHERKTARDGARLRAEERRKVVRNLRLEEGDLAGAQLGAMRAQERIAARIEYLREEEENLASETTAANREQASLAEKMEKAVQESRRAEKQSSIARKHLSEAEHRCEHLKASIADVRAGRQDLALVLEARNAERLLLEQLLVTWDGASEGVRFLASNSTWSRSSVRVISDLFSCAPSCRPALDAALGTLGDCFVVGTEAELHAAIDLLKGHQMGQALFLVLDRLPESLPPIPEEGKTALLSQIRVHSAEYQPLARMLLADTFVVEDLDEASGPGRFVTPDGAWKDARGFVHAGGGGGGSVSRTERRGGLEEARKDCARLADEISQRSERIKALEAELEAIRLDKVRTDALEAASQLESARKGLLRVEQEQAALSARARAAMERHARVVEESRMQIDAADETSVREAAVRLEEVRSDLATAESALDDAQRRYHEALEAFGSAGLDAQAAHGECEQFSRDITATKSWLATYEQKAAKRRLRQVSLREEAATATRRVNEFEHELERVLGQRSGLDQAVEKAREKLLDIRVAIDRLEAELRRVRRAREEMLQEENSLAVALAGLEARIADLLERIPGIAEADLPVVGEAEAELEELEQKLGAMGGVNELALEQYATEEERLTFLTEQYDDLVKSRETLSRTISEINGTASARFLDTFAAIERSFADLFRELFGDGASGHLALANPDNPLETSIGVVARPRGKRPIRLSQLSSGEKTLTAIALLFAIYLVKPSPFCFLDEVDAPLDDANVDRFMRLIRRFSLDTQFVLVTHNKRTMEMADRLYGITMQEQGVSSLVGVQFEEAVQLVG